MQCLSPAQAGDQPGSPSESPELRDQQVTQFVIHDGWIGIALGPKADGRQPAMHPRPMSEDADEQE